MDWDLFIGIVGGGCDDYDPTTINDIVNEFCQCGGTPLADDCLGVAMGGAWPGTACDDGNPLTFPDVWSASCECVGDTVGSNTVSGLVFLDLDGNGVFDGTDLPVENRAITLTGANYAYTTFSGTGGQFSAQVWTDVYTLTVAPGPWDAQAGVPPVADVMGAGLVSSGHVLVLAPTSLEVDLDVALTGAWPPPRPGFETALQLFVHNTGTVPTGGTLTLTFDPLQEHVASGSGATVMGNTVTWAIPELALGQLAYREVWLSTPLSVPLGTLLDHQAIVQTVPPDADPGNDVALLTQEVVGSWDPNDKMVMPVALAPQDVLDAKAVQYTIRFQNTGTWYAEDVLITDTLSADLDPSTFQFIGSSHPCTIIFTDGILQFRFENILLPDSTSNEPESHGFVLFRIRPFTDLLPGDSVDNKANIYFDFNEPVITDDATFHVESTTTAVSSPYRNTDITIWPNPAKEWISLSAGEGEGMHISIVDAQGRVRKSGIKSNKGVATVPLIGMAAGIYVIRIEHERAVTHVRFMKVQGP